jgi:hypothetical protein
VIASGGYIPEIDRVPEVYRHLALLDPEAPALINSLATTYDIYFITARSFDDALLVTKRWLAKNGVDIAALAGIITNQHRHMKASLVKKLNSQLHFDDDPLVAVACCARGILFLGERRDRWFPEAEAIRRIVPTVYSWQRVAKSIDAQLGPQQQLPLAPSLDELLAGAKKYHMTDDEKHRQLVSFAFGNVALHNPNTTLRDIEIAAKDLLGR